MAQWKESACGVGDLGLIPGSGRSPGGGHGNPLQNSCLGNPMDRGAWWATVHGVTKESEMTLVTKQQHQRLSTYCALYMSDPEQKTGKQLRWVIVAGRKNEQAEDKRG